MDEKLNKIAFENKTKWCVYFIILMGVIIRVIKFGSTPCGFNQDEAFAGYEAFSLLNYGIDSAGYHNPCYFVSWGSGMNVLQSYLAIPFMKVFGCSIITLRLPQLILSCTSLPVFYLLIKKIFSYETALLGLFLLVISPWHIMLSRWGLESNLAPALLLMGMYFLIRGVEEKQYLIFSAIIYGISLYSYSITWIVVPLTIIACGLYIIFTKKKYPYFIVQFQQLYYLLWHCLLFFFYL
ncbi:MAG: glycosyltransferase family 39 protein [Oscillospiraceae bacterium]